MKATVTQSLGDNMNVFSPRHVTIISIKILDVRDITHMSQVLTRRTSVGFSLFLPSRNFKEKSYKLLRNEKRIENEQETERVTLFFFSRPPIILSIADSKCCIVIIGLSFLAAIKAPSLQTLAMSAPANPGVRAASL